MVNVNGECCLSMLIKDRILKLLQKQKEGLTITDITKFLQIHYSTSSKYLTVLEAEGKIIHRDIGMAKLFRIRDNHEF